MAAYNRPVGALAAMGLAVTAGYLTARRHLRHQLATAHHAATHDALTGIRNRAGLAALADTFITDQHRAGHLVVVALVDLVGFKQVNDAHGHAAGDHILTTTAHRLRMYAPGGIAARLGGDEFALITTGTITDSAAGLHALLTTPVDYDGRPLAVGATIGACHATPAFTAAVWLHRADLAMYDARHRRATTALFTDALASRLDAARPAQRTRDTARPTSRLAVTPAARRAAA
jgi:diguanylate cyclase (GGDEF)-like protein